MRIWTCAILCLASFSPHAYNQTFDKSRFRQAIEMPGAHIVFGVNFRSNERDSRGCKYDPADKIAELQKKLTGAPDDADVYLELRAVYLECIKDEKKAQEKAHEMVAKAEALLRPHVQTSDPKQAYLLVLYGGVLEAMNDYPWNECEKLAQRAVSLAPNDWRTLTYLAHVRHQQIPTILCGGDDKRLPKERRTQEVIGMLYLQRFRTQHVDEAEKTLNEALQLHDKAKELAPNEPKRQSLRYGFRLTEVVLRNGINAARGQKPSYPKQQLERLALDELEVTARLHPDHMLWQSQLAHQLILLGWHANSPKDGAAPKTFRPARAEDQEAIRAALANIEKLANDSRGETAIFCRSTLTALHSSMQDHAGVAVHARKILEIDAKNASALEQLQQAAVLQGRTADAVQIGQVLVHNVPTARSWYLFAKAQTLEGRYDQAEQACRSGLKLNPNDVHCLLGLSALMMRRGDDADTLKAAGTLLDLARRECRPDSAAAMFIELDYLSHVHQALSGDPALARVRLQRMQSEHPDHPRYGKILSAFGS